MILDVSEIEGRIPREFGRDAVEIPGARALLAALKAANAPWAVVTSGTGPLVSGWLEVMQLPSPKYLVVAEDVEAGKPDPACYQLGKQRLGLDAEVEALVVEDAPAGVRAGKAAGCRVIGLLTTHPIAQLIDAGADWIIKDLQSIRYLGEDANQGIKIEISDSLRSPK